MLAMIASRAGAKQVVACEAKKPIADVASYIVQHNGAYADAVFPFSLYAIEPSYLIDLYICYVLRCYASGFLNIKVVPKHSSQLTVGPDGDLPVRRVVV